jgi:hypothetical protein
MELPSGNPTDKKNLLNRPAAVPRHPINEHFLHYRSALWGILLFALVATPVTSQEVDQADPGQEETEQAAGSKGSGDSEADADKSGFLILPVFITEPAIGEGLGVALVYFHEQKESRRATTARNFGQTGRRAKPPPTATGVFGFKTNEDTEGVGVGHTRTFADDTYRFTGAAADALVNTTFYLGDAPFKFALEGDVLYATLKRRLAESNMFAGVSTSILTADVDFNIEPEEVDLFDFSFRDVGVAASVIYDAIDDSMLPNSGQKVDLTVWRYDDAIGGDFDYWKTQLKAYSYHQLTERFVLGIRFDVAKADGEVPFYAEPYVNLRGIPALRYQGESAGALEVAGRLNISEKIAAFAFTGVGFANARPPIEDTDDDIRTVGIGFR